MKRVLSLAVVMVLTACSGVSENVAENALEAAIEDELGGDASVQLDDDSVQIQTEDGSQSIGIGGGAEVPEGFPIPIPDGGTVSYSFTDSAAGTSVVIVDYPASALEEIVAEMEDYFSAYSDVQTVQMSNPTQYIWNTSDGSQSVTVAEWDETTVQVSMSVTG